jgi:hypothetical protein
MATTIYGDKTVADKTPDKKLLAVLDAMSRPVHAMIISTDLVTPDQQVAVFATIDRYGTATLGECMAALQPHDRPVAALIALAELGLIAFDREAEFDEHVTVWRIR